MLFTCIQAKSESTLWILMPNIWKWSNQCIRPQVINTMEHNIDDNSDNSQLHIL